MSATIVETEEPMLTGPLDEQTQDAPAYVVTRHALATTEDAPSPPIAEIETEVEEEATYKSRRPYFSGFCGTGPCRDEQYRNKAGELVRHCPYEAHNGEKVIPRVLCCSCTCHNDPDRAGQALANNDPEKDTTR